MPKRSRKPAYRAPVKKSPKPREAIAATVRSAEPLTYATWRAHAAALLGRPGTMPEREWKRLYVVGTGLGEAVRQAQLYRDHMSAAQRSR